MADKNKIRVAVLEGDYANNYLCGLGLPLSLSLTLQTRNLQLSGALWKAKASASGFSISIYWLVLLLKRRRQRSPEGGGINVNVRWFLEYLTVKLILNWLSLLNLWKLVSQIMSTPALKKCLMAVNLWTKLLVLRSSSHEVKDGIHGVAYSLNDGESGWTQWHQLLERSRKTCSYLITLDVDFLLIIRSTTHLNLIVTLHLKRMSVATVIPTGANDDVHFDMVDNTPGLTVQTRRTRTWTPIATRTRARLKKWLK